MEKKVVGRKKCCENDISSQQKSPPSFVLSTDNSPSNEENNKISSVILDSIRIVYCFTGHRGFMDYGDLFQRIHLL